MNNKKHVEKIKSDDITFWAKNVNSNTTLVFLHGINSSASFASSIGQYNTNFNIISLDMPGSVTGATYENLSIEKIAKVTSDFIKKNIHSRKIVLLGHSLGGAVAAHIANMNRRISEVVFVSPLTPNVIGSPGYKIAESIVDVDSNQGGMAKKMFITSSIKFLVSALGFKTPKSFLDKESNEYALMNNNVYNKKYLKQTLANEYKNIKQKKSFIISDKDAIVNANGVKKFAKSLKADLVVLPGNHHNPFKAHPEKMVELLNDKYKFKKRAFSKRIISYN